MGKREPEIDHQEEKLALTIALSSNGTIGSLERVWGISPLSVHRDGRVVTGTCLHIFVNGGHKYTLAYMGLTLAQLMKAIA